MSGSDGTDKQRVNDAYLHSALTERIIAAFFDVYDELGFGFLEATYVESLSDVLTSFGLSTAREVPIDIQFRGRRVGHYRLDLVVQESVIVECKSTHALAAHDERQLTNYLRATPYEVGLLLHFGPQPKVRRLIFTNDRKRRDTNNKWLSASPLPDSSVSVP